MKCLGCLTSQTRFFLDYFFVIQFIWMTDKNQKQTVQKAMDYMKNNPYARGYTHPQNSQQGQVGYGTQVAERESRYQSAHYTDYFKHPLGYPGYGLPNIPLKNYRMDASSISSMYPNNPLQSQQPAAPTDIHNQQASGSNYYQMGMQQNSPYPYNYQYPQYPYPSMYPPSYGYPPYYYNRPDLYPGAAGSASGLLGSQSAMPSQSYPPQNAYVPPSGAQPSSPMVKQEIVISSDEERERGGVRREPTHDMSQIRQKIQERMQKAELKKELKKQQPDVGTPKKPEVDDKKVLPFSVKHKRIFKEEKEAKGHRQHKHEKAEKKKQVLPPVEETSKGILKEEKLLQDKIAASLKHFEFKPNFSKLPVKGGPEQGGEGEEKSLGVQLVNESKENQRREKVKDDHPLKELRYSESHGRIRLGTCYQSCIPDLLGSSKQGMFRKKVQQGLQEREISAITF